MLAIPFDSRASHIVCRIYVCTAVVHAFTIPYIIH